MHWILVITLSIGGHSFTYERAAVFDKKAECQVSGYKLIQSLKKKSYGASGFCELEYDA